jgi:hypothetical protein
MIMPTTPGPEVQARSRRAKRRTRTRAMDTATTTQALTPSSVIVRTSGACSPTSDSSAATVKMSLVAEMIPITRNGWSWKPPLSSRAMIVLTNSMGRATE